MTASDEIHGVPVSGGLAERSVPSLAAATPASRALTDTRSKPSASASGRQPEGLVRIGPRTLTANWLDKQAIAIATGKEEDFSALHRLLDETMNALCLDPAEARVGLLARTIAILRVKIEVLEALSDQVLSNRDYAAAQAVQRALDTTMKRFLGLVAEHRLSTTSTRRSVAVAVVSQNAQINVTGER